VRSCAKQCILLNRGIIVISYIVSCKGKDLKASVEESRPGSYKVVLDGREQTVDFLEPQHDLFSLIIEGKSYEVDVDSCEGSDSLGVNICGYRFEVEVAEEKKRNLHSRMVFGPAGRQEIKSPMAGNVWKVLVREGDQVEAGRLLIILSAMKMENQIKTPIAGVVTSVTASEGGSVAAGDSLCVVEPSA
jgi:biotin carboxyl carrier protein